jgi:hypothetical protein
MLVREGDRIYLEASGKAESAANVVTPDYYTQLPQIRLTGDSSGRSTLPETRTEVTLDGNDVAKLVECALRHASPNMRYGVLAAIWNHPDSFRQIFRFGLNAPLGFPEIRKIVAEELDNSSPKPEAPASNPVKPAVEALLPRMPLPAHLRDRGRRTE